MNINRLLLRAGLFLMLLPTSFAVSSSPEQVLITRLLQGGLNIYFRHEATNWSQQDHIQQARDWLSCDPEKVRQLSQQGRQRAAETGRFMHDLKIPVSEVLASPYCRTMETARQLGLGPVKPSTLVMNLRVASYFGGRQNIIDSARALLASPPTPGSNRVIVAHGNVAQAATPVYPDEGEAVVFKPDGKGGFNVIARIPPQRWRQLVNVHY